MGNKIENFKEGIIHLKALSKLRKLSINLDEEEQVEYVI